MRKRKTLTPQEQSEILTLISAGYSRTTAAKYIHRAPTTLRNAMLENPEFAAQVAKAEEGTEVFYLSRIRTAAQMPQYWRAAAWILERRLPNRYGAQKPESLTVEQVQKFMATRIQIIADELPNDEQRPKVIKQ